MVSIASDIKIVSLVSPPITALKAKVKVPIKISPPKIYIKIPPKVYLLTIMIPLKFQINKFHFILLSSFGTKKVFLDFGRWNEEG